ncbi:MAG TPA: hypothetical protein VFW83_09385 [Bryobacteraceae bacterium]|nr:hypothetical protein [Bryobacteraceae bacterium]
MARFVQYELRTTAVSAAREFYTDVLGAHVWDSNLSVISLPERAAAQGAPAHWLGHIGVSDLETSVSRVVAAGGQRLGPSVLRDSFGAVFAVSSERADANHAPVAWHLHHSTDHERSFALYAELFGWSSAGLMDLGPDLGCHRLFAWDDPARAVGSMANTARLPHIHPQWLFFFEAADLEASLAKVLTQGGKVAQRVRNLRGDFLAACADPQGGAFGLYQFAR